MTARVIVGVDPGGRYTGIAARCKDQLAAYQLLQRRSEEPLDAWCARCRYEIEHMRHDALLHTGHGSNAPIIAVEGVNSPNPHMGIIAVRGLLDTAAVYGAIVSLADAVTVTVPPGQHGNRFLYAYPKEIGKGKYSTIKHVRAAYDIAGAAQTLFKWQQAAHDEVERRRLGPDTKHQTRVLDRLEDRRFITLRETAVHRHVELCR